MHQWNGGGTVCRNGEDHREENHRFHRGGELARRRGSPPAELHGAQGNRERGDPLYHVKVPVEDVIWGEGKGLKLALITLNTGRADPPRLLRGGRQALPGDRADLGHERVQWGQPVGRHDAIAQKIGRMAAETFAMEAVSDLASLMADQGNRDIRLEAALAKMWNTELGWRIVDDTLQIKEGRAMRPRDSLRKRGERPDPVERMLRDFRINLIFEDQARSCDCSLPGRRWTPI